MKAFLREFLIFGIKQAYACLFGGYLLALILITRYYYPFHGLLRYDFLFIAALVFQAFLLLSRLESLKEAYVVLAFHVLAMLMEIFKTSDAIRAWSYPGSFTLGIGNVPLFAGFMYSAVGSYIARVWRGFDFKFSNYPRFGYSLILVALIYLNFFTHHYIPDLRWVLLAWAFVLYARVQVYFKVAEVYRRMPLMLGWFLVALFIWFAENISTYTATWVYPTQKTAWSVVPMSKLTAWWLLVMLSFVLVSIVHRPRDMATDVPSGAGGE